MKLPGLRIVARKQARTYGGSLKLSIREGNGMRPLENCGLKRRGANFMEPNSLSGLMYLSTPGEGEGDSGGG